MDGVRAISDPSNQLNIVEVMVAIHGINNTKFGSSVVQNNNTIVNTTLYDMSDDYVRRSVFIFMFLFIVSCCLLTLLFFQLFFL